jgi:hypothetical protein
MHIFIRHSSKDKLLARQLAQRLSTTGLKVWIPEDEVLPGDNWAKKVGQALGESDLMVVLVTPHAFETGGMSHFESFLLSVEHFEI